MLVGAVSKHIAHQEVHHACDHCGKANCIEFSVEISYFHIFFIPAFVADKEVYSFCNQCHTQHRLSNMPSHFVFDARELKKKTRAPIWYYSMAFVVLLLPFIMIGLMPSDEDMKQKKLAHTHYLRYPKIDDVYTFEQYDGMYTLLKVYDVGKDSVWVIVNNYEADYGYKLEDHNNALGFFRGDTISIYREELIPMLDDYVITDVERPMEE